MVAKEFFDNPPTTDACVGRYGSWSKPTKTFRNGYFQHIVWLGVSGYIIINHFAPKEILLVDPWPSYRRTAAGRGTPGSKKRLLKLTNWLRKRVEEGYHLSGILVTHEHFDHTDDIAAIFELLAAPQGRSISIENMKGNISFSTPPVPFVSLPTIYADYYSEKKIRSQDRAREPHLYFEKIVNAEGAPVYYRTIKKKPATKCRTALHTFDAGGFEVTPCVWDHKSFSRFSRNVFGAPGGGQRITAMNVRWKCVENSKRTLILGSAGEMNSAYTEDGIIDLPTEEQEIRTDTLIQAITRRGKKFDACVNYQVNNIIVADYVIPSHWENFIAGPPRKKLYDRKRKRRIRGYVDCWRDALREKKDNIETEREVSKCISLGRFGFSYPNDYLVVPDCCSMEW